MYVIVFLGFGSVSIEGTVPVSYPNNKLAGFLAIIYCAPGAVGDRRREVCHLRRPWPWLLVRGIDFGTRFGAGKAIALRARALHSMNRNLRSKDKRQPNRWRKQIVVHGTAAEFQRMIH